MIYHAHFYISLFTILTMTAFSQVTVSRAEAESIFFKRNFSNVIIFGDSLSDIGNFPESLTFIGDTDSDSGFFTNAYVPISNPVNPADDRILPGTRLRFPPTNGSSTVFRLTLPPQLQLCTITPLQIECVNREFRSINWTEYFVYNAVLRGLLAPHADFRPWLVQFKEATASIRQSVNYAFVSALSDGECANFNLTRLPCTPGGKSLQESVFDAQKQYRDNQSDSDTGLNQVRRSVVIVPALSKQIEMFEADLKSGQVEVNDRTLFIMYTGANDISDAFFKFLDGKRTFADFLLALNVTIPRKIAGARDQNSGVNLLLELGAKNIIVIGQFNLGLTPELLTGAGVSGLLAKHAVAAPFDELLRMFNNSLQNRVSDFDGSMVGYVDIQTPISNAANSFFVGFRRGYFFSIGERCVVATSEIVQQGEAASCFKRKDVPTPIGFWNDAHLSTQYYQLIAAAVLDRFIPTLGIQNQLSGFPQTSSSEPSPQELEGSLLRWYRR